MTAQEFERMKREVGLEMVRKVLEGADFSQGVDLLTEEQLEAYTWLEWLYYDGEITYRQLWALCGKPLSK